MNGLVATMMGWGGDNLMSAVLAALMLGAMVVGYCAAAPGSPLAIRLGTLKDRVSGKAPVGKKTRSFTIPSIGAVCSSAAVPAGRSANSAPSP